MEIYTSYFGNYKHIPHEYQCVSIANSKPEGLFIPECNLLKPDWNIVQAYKNKDISHDDFAKLYIGKLNIVPAFKYFESLRQIALSNPLVLMCWEKDHTICHRTIAAYWLVKNCFATYKGELSNEETTIDL